MSLGMRNWCIALVAISVGLFVGAVGALTTNLTGAYALFGAGSITSLVVASMLVYAYVQRRKARSGRAASEAAKREAIVAASKASTRQRAGAVSIGVQRASSLLRAFLDGLSSGTDDARAAVLYQEEYRARVEGSYKAAKGVGFGDAVLDRLCASPKTVDELSLLCCRLEDLAERMGARPHS